jgi:hypothetical protein
MDTVHRPRWWKTWITEETWTLIDKIAALHRYHDIESRAQSHRFNRRITNSIKRDRQKQTTEFGVSIEAMLTGIKITMPSRHGTNMPVARAGTHRDNT